MKIDRLADIPLNMVHKYVNREQLIIMISDQQLSRAISYCNHFQLNGLELSEVATRYNNTDAMKIELLKGIFIHCPNSKSKVFVDSALKICNAILGADNNGQSMTARMYVSVFRTISRFCPDSVVDKELLRNTGHFITTYQYDRRIIDDVINSEKITLNDLDYVLLKNKHLISWMEGIDEHKLSTIPEKYHDILIRHRNRLKLTGEI